jgi:hypothetical protein
MRPRQDLGLNQQSERWNQKSSSTSQPSGFSAATQTRQHLLAFQHVNQYQAGVLTNRLRKSSVGENQEAAKDEHANVQCGGTIAACATLPIRMAT